MTTIEPRVAERRKNVSEDRARNRLKWILGVIALISLVVIGLWLIRSPLLSVSTITVSGAQRTDPAAIVDELGVVVGVPMIDVDGGAIQQAVEADPWVATAEVGVQWPGTINVTVTEHVPVAPARYGSGWVMLSKESTVIESIPAPVEGVFLVDINVDDTPIGSPIEDPLVAGALEFGSLLRSDLAADAVMYSEDGYLVANVSGYVVSLGRPVELEDKALVLASLIDSGLPEAAEINLIAPTRPAVLDPQTLILESQTDEATSSQPGETSDAQTDETTDSQTNETNP